MYNMKTIKTIAFAVSALGAFAASAGDWYWRGNGAAWNGTDNASDTASGRWWNADKNGTGAWGIPSASGDNAYVGNGGLCVVPSGCTVSGSDVKNIFINTAGATSDGSTLRVVEGATLSGVAISVCGIGSWGGTEGILHIDGGNLTLGNASAKRGLLIGCTTTPDGIGRAWMTGGSLSVSQSFHIGYFGASSATTSSRGVFALTNGTVTSEVDVYIGNITSRWDVVEGGTFIQAGGSMSVASGKTIYVCGTGSSYDMSGGTLLDANIQVAYGGTLRFSGNAEYSGKPSLGGYQYERAIPGFTNVLEIAGGSVTIQGSSGSGMGGGSNAKIPCRVVQTGGDLTVLGLMGFGNANFLFEISGGTMTVTNNLDGSGSARMVTCDKPYYFRIKGTPTVSVGECANWDGTYYNYQTNSIVEHVIDHRGLTPIIQRSGSYWWLPGHQRLRPDGGVQLLSTNIFELTRTTGCANNVRKDYLSSMPDADLWMEKAISDDAGKAYGCELNESAAISLGTANGQVSFSARPFGHVDLGPVRTNNLKRLDVALTVEAPTGKTLEETLAKVAVGLNDAGYLNVTTDASASRNVRFSIPAEWVSDRNAETRLLFDFTETPMPVGGLLAGPGESSYPTVTNALVSSVSVECAKIHSGLIITVR